MTKKRMLVAAMAFAASTMALQPAGAASEEVLLSEPARFNDCVTIVDQTLAGLNANPIQVEKIAHSSAIYKVRFMSVEADLVFTCNDVQQTMLVKRITPGQWKEARK